jgi:hypothetical protein
MFIVFSVGMENYRDFQRRKTLEGAVNRVKSHLRLAQEMALSGTKPADCVTSNLALVNVTFQRDSTITYSIHGLCTDGINPPALYSYDASYSLEPDYTGIEITGPLLIEFNTLGRGVKTDVDLIYTLTQPTTGNLDNITVTKGGEIK